MDWEAYDYRPKKPKQPDPWLKWQVPSEQARTLGKIFARYAFFDRPSFRRPLQLEQ